MMVSFGQSREIRDGDATAYDLGRRNAEAGRVVFDGMEAWRGDGDNVKRALCLAGFEAQRIERNIGSYPVLLHKGRRSFWAIGPELYQATLGEKPVLHGGGYPNLRALFKLKGEVI